jgi:hypothetical protein
MQSPIALFNLGIAELVILALLGLVVVAVPLSLAIVFWAVFRSRSRDKKGNEE